MGKFIFLNIYMGLPPGLYGFMTWVLALLATAALHFLAFQLISRFVIQKEAKIPSMALKKLYVPSLLLLFILATYFLLPLLNFPGPYENLARHALSLLTIAFVAWMLFIVVLVARKFVLRKHNISEKDNLRAREVTTKLNMITKIAEFLIVIVAVSIALMTFDPIRKIGLSLLASADIAGIIIGFAAQKVIATVLAGFQIAITQPIRIDDVVIVEGEWGWIEEINLTFVVVKLWDKRRLVMPTTYFIEKPFQNWTRTSASIIKTVFIYTDYNVPVDKIREELGNILKSTALWDGEVNVLQVTDAKKRCIKLRALVSAQDSPKAWDLRVYVREKLISFLQKNYPGSLPQSRIMLTGQISGKSPQKP